MKTPGRGGPTVICQARFAGQVQGWTDFILPPNGIIKERASALLAERIKIKDKIIKLDKLILVNLSSIFRL
ncbi:MAG: hypothetical protein KBC81_02025 [Candidatus Pacebacteria bacterium]|nr:hypothetical protein [Candidatus Paceibacterota bacterium]